METYVNHCKKNHSICNDEKENVKKCYLCRTKVHIIAKKFHDAIYHPGVLATGKNLVRKTESLEINELNKSLTKIECDFCNESLVFKNYRRHVKKYHPEINFKEQVKCGKCNMRVFKTAFKFHKEIFHKSVKVKCHPARDFEPRPRRKLKLPKALMKHVQFESGSPNYTQSVQDQHPPPPSQPSEFQPNPVPVSDGSTDHMNINTE